VIAEESGNMITLSSLTVDDKGKKVSTVDAAS
jgi:hypothetical protein